jgi:hypothetical protein
VTGIAASHVAYELISLMATYAKEHNDDRNS